MKQEYIAIPVLIAGGGGTPVHRRATQLLSPHPVGLNQSGTALDTSHFDSKVAYNGGYLPE